MDCQRRFNLRNCFAFALCSSGILVISVITGCSGGNASSMMPMSGTGTVNVSISDPPSCKNPNGNFDHVYIRSAPSRHTSIPTQRTTGPAGRNWRRSSPISPRRSISFPPLKQPASSRNSAPPVSRSAVTSRFDFSSSLTVPRRATLFPPATFARATVTTVWFSVMAPCTSST